jgi:hypothetical protein
VTQALEYKQGALSLNPHIAKKKKKQQHQMASEANQPTNLKDTCPF